MNTTDKPLLRAMLYLAGAVVLWGTSYAVTKSAYADMPPMYVVWFRMMLATLAFLPLLPRVPKPDYRPGDWKWLGLAVLFIPCMYFAFEGYAISFTTSSQAGLVTAVMPLVVALAAWVVMREQPTRRTVIGAIVSVVGVAALSLTGVSQSAAPNPLLGNLLELGAVLGGAGSTLVVKRLSSRYSPLLLTGLQMATGSVFFIPLALASGSIQLSVIPVSGWLAIAYLGIGCGLGAFSLYNSSLSLLPASRAALGINAVPVVALVSGWLALGERMSALQVVACAIILGSVLFAQLGVRRTRTRG